VFPLWMNHTSQARRAGVPHGIGQEVDWEANYGLSGSVNLARSGRECPMAAGDKREQIDLRIKAWESELERIRLALARAPDSMHDRYHPTFREVYGAKEIVKSRWEAVRGVYQPEPAAIQRLQDALEAMEKAWAIAQPKFADLLES